jgi:putative SOS response-associated peptidase YedK
VFLNPAILDEGTVDTWLEPSQDAAILHSLRVLCADDVLTANPVSTLVNSLKYQGPALIAPA